MTKMNRRELLAGLASALLLSRRAAAPQLPPIEVYKDPTCGCCLQWVGHVQRAGFQTRVNDVASIESVKIAHNVPMRLASCHTAIVGGYVIEGHVPVSDIQRLLKERPQIAGLAVPGMPIGSPGMEGPGGKPYQVLAFDKSGATTVYSTQQPLR